MVEFVMSFIRWFGAFLRSRNSPAFDIRTLREQISVPKREKPRPRSSTRDQVFYVLLKLVTFVAKDFGAGCREHVRRDERGE